ncbi:bifunctional diguanylate cyclase/phosphodiesterase [Vibrio sagamiensis]|uniref:cyclic-guanylate-specific phosphodiesterase n=1 Tax=Vibrio sagamiensis NBRC 104589 TaxID=1219064 RepID=A0A511Q9L4_9VIBR|nr:bifunctional diguanylate cyclase/phosphodiesterase [Vibrio sagamiensis]PNQ71390.1 bifunctional diguanylate cyclase/phosphodiesterase [Vibrio agarivorans]GEM73983.1 bifunctional diguanylate cyclase/phosphodiesterase [Vibrio sagamiensis NBRC 104589]
MPYQQLQYWFTRLTANSPSFYAIIDKNFHYQMVSDRYCAIAGLTKKQIVGLDDEQLLGKQFYQQLAPYYQQAFNGEYLTAEITLGETGLETKLYFSLIPIYEEHSISAVFVHAIDTSEKHLLSCSIKTPEKKVSLLMETLSDGILLIKEDTIVTANPSSARLLGVSSPDDLIGTPLSSSFMGANRKKIFGSNTTHFLSTKPYICVTSLKLEQERELQLKSSLLINFGELTQLVLIQDVDKPTLSNFSNSWHDTYIDDFTKLYSRQGFTKHIDQLIEFKIPQLLLYLDIDNFKRINDSLGHLIGDKVIKEIATRLRKKLPRQCIIAHLGADEFGVLLPNPESAHTADILSQQIVSLINQPFDLQHFTKQLTCSVGSVYYPQYGHNARSLLQNADTAMHQAKKRGRNYLSKFNDRMNKEARMRLWLEIELQKALQQNGLEVWYQPKVTTRDFSINGAEALVRWKHPVEGYISPSVFIPVAEQAGLIEQLGRIVMREVFANVKHWKHQGILPGRIAINLSAQQFQNPHLIDYVEKMIRTTKLDPSCITFELTESAVMSDSQHTLQMLNSIKKLGFTLSIDDFGTGYSSLSYLARFPIDELKIDREFINDIDMSPKQVTVIENIINLGKSLNMNVVAEGVESHQQAALLSNLQCHSIQGFHFYRPQPKHDVETLFAQCLYQKS